MMTSGDDQLTNDNLGSDGDVFYEILMQAHEGLSEAKSHALNIRLVLLMANHIGSLEDLELLIETAKDDGS